MTAVVIVGAGAAGLGAALGLAAAGHRVTVVERDGPTDARSGRDAFDSWERPHVPQFRQPHTILARARNLLADRAPQVIDRLLADGVQEVNFIKMFSPPERVRPEDDAFTAFMTRRPVFEWALRQVAEETDGVDIQSDSTVTGLVLENAEDQVLVRGVRTAEGELLADVVIDAAGRRSPVCRWLAEAGAPLPEQVEDCGVTYHSRHFQLTPGSDLALPLLVLLRFGLKGLGTITFPGDHDTFSLCLVPASWDDELKVLRHNWAWDAAASALPALRPWVDPANATPISDVATMAGHQNLRRQIVADGRPIALGVLPVGDALCTTNPTNGWGVSMALTTAFAAVDAIHDAGGDAVETVLRYHEATRSEVDDVFTESAALDRLTGYWWRGEDIPPGEQAEADRQALLRALSLGAMRDTELGRVLLRRVNLLESPRQTLSDPALLAQVEALRDRSDAAEAPASAGSGPSRDDVLAAVAAAAP